MLINVIIALGVFLFMEGVAWFTHKYVMHGFMWNWHRDHHNHHKGFFEKNDLFSVVFSVIAAGSIMIGLEVTSVWYLAPIGFGVTLYGICYFVFHDIIVHRRIRLKMKHTNPYMLRIMRAHYIHHKVHTRDGAEAFGFLYAPKKFDKK
jgi:beta-carotene 3-hydroxylase